VVPDEQAGAPRRAQGYFRLPDKLQAHKFLLIIRQQMNSGPTEESQIAC
jgi:hypothetical protein